LTPSKAATAAVSADARAASVPGATPHRDVAGRWCETGNITTPENRPVFARPFLRLKVVIS
jgi:hypothetical protein